MPRTIPKVSRIIPSVKGGWLYRPQSGAAPIVVGSGAWYDWLEHHRVFRFVDAGGTFTARKKATAASELGWQACRRQVGKASRLWLGASATLTLQLLQAAAQTLAQAPDQPSTLPQACLQSARSALEWIPPVAWRYPLVFSFHWLLGPLTPACTRACRPRTFGN